MCQGWQKNSVSSRYLIKCKNESGKNETLPKAQWFQIIYEIATELLIVHITI